MLQILLFYRLFVLEHCLQRESDEFIVFQSRKTFEKSDCKKVNDIIMHINMQMNKLLIQCHIGVSGTVGQ